jgi:lysyl-tRNA synthetase, class I
MRGIFVRIKEFMNQKQSEHWVDKVVKNILAWGEENNIKKFHVDDMKTPSGRVHTGSLRGALLHDVVAKALKEKTDKEVINTFVINNMDSMDGLPAYLDKNEYEQHMGKPLNKISTPPLDKSGIDFKDTPKDELEKYKQAKNFGELYAIDFILAFNKLGATQEIIWSSDLYESGQMDKVIKLALDNVEKIKKVYKEVANYDLPENWYPFQVICPQCGKVGTTLTTGWDGSEITFECQENKVEWAKGCGYKGKASPFGGTGKLLWKTDWPAHWVTMGVNVEGAGKDHCTAGGSRDMANGILEKAFKSLVPFDIPYEWILLRGAKMSSSKGVGTSAKEFVELFPAEVGRFLFVNKHYNSVVDFDPNTMAIPDLFDSYDEAASIYWGKEGDQRLARAFELSQVNEVPEKHFIPRFRDVALWSQQLSGDKLVTAFEKVKGEKLTDFEEGLVKERQNYAKIWIDRYAPEEFRLTANEDLPEKAKDLSDEQKEFLTKVIDLVEQKDWTEDELQQAIYDLAKESLGAKQGFQTIYLAFLGKIYGPKAGGFLLSLDKDLRRKRLEQVQMFSEDVVEIVTEVINSETDLRISDEVRKKFPGIFFAQILIKNIDIKRSDSTLEALKEKILKEKESLSTEDISKIQAIQEYRKLFKATGIDFHSKRPSPDALLRRIAQGKGLYNINTAVDAYNLAVIETGIGLGGFDAGNLVLPVVMRFSKQGEQMLLLGDKEETILKDGQLVYADKEKPVTINLNYRDINDTKITEKTKNIMLYADGAPGLAENEVVEALKKGAEYITQFCGGEAGEIEVIK